jgi:hypothetical protein
MNKFIGHSEVVTTNNYKTLKSIVTTAESESELLYDWRYTANQLVLAPSPLRLTTRIFFSIEHLLS